MKRKITLNGRQIEYELTYKKVKNINLRIRADGSVAASANRLVSVAAIEAFMRDKAAYILAALDRCIAPAPLTYTDGETVRFLGRDVPLCVREGKAPGVNFDGQRIQLTVKDAQNLVLKKNTLQAWLDAQCKSIVQQKCNAIYPHFARLGVPFPTLSYRSMSSRWGSCKTQGAAITFNKRLIELPEECIEYVAAHEFTHFLQPDHSAEFYRKLALVMPDWKQRREKLKARE